MNINSGSFEWIQSLVVGYADTAANNLGDGSGERAWATPVVSFARGDDPIFLDFKRHVGPEHWTPLEAFHLKHTEPVDAADLAVISWILPQTKASKEDNGRMTKYPAERWARSRIFGEQFNSDLRRHVAQSLEYAGYPALAPMLLDEYTAYRSERFFLASTWSERHMAFACGLGTFGICDGLITSVGKAIRLGSVVAKIAVPPAARPYSDHRAYCLYASEGTCGKCIERCPCGALSTDGHDKEICRTYLSDVTKPHVTKTYGFDGYGCGLCQTNVPCESGIP